MLGSSYSQHQDQFSQYIQLSFASTILHPLFAVSILNEVQNPEVSYKTLNALNLYKSRRISPTPTCTTCFCGCVACVVEIWDFSRALRQRSLLTEVIIYSIYKITYVQNRKPARKQAQ